MLASAPAAAVAVRGGVGGGTASSDFYQRLRPLRLGGLVTALLALLLAVAIVGGLFGDPVSFTANPAPLLVWVDFWVGLGILSALVGNVWDLVSPLNAAARALDRLLARRGVSARRYPDWLGVWPAVLLLLAWSWMELVWPEATRGRPLALVLIAYLVLQLAGAALFGAEVWLSRCELFTVFARTFGRFGPLELYVRRTEEHCRAERCDLDGERIGCPSCWLHADPADRGIRLRLYGAGVRREPPLGEGGGAFVVALLATIVYDGYRGTVWYRRLLDALTLSGGRDVLAGTLVMALVVGAFFLAFLAVCGAVTRLEEGDLDAVARRYAPTLVPIAAVYFVAHYFLYFVDVVQFTPGTVADPFEREWVPDYLPWTGIPGVLVWYLQAGLIVWGHVVAVLEAHRVSLTRHRRPRTALVAQLPLVLLMVAYTFSGLWVLGEALRGE